MEILEGYAGALEAMAEKAVWKAARVGSGEAAKVVGSAAAETAVD